MSQGERIRTPWKRRWALFRQRVLPWVSFAGSVVLVAWLWTKQGGPPGGIGEVQAVRVDIVAQVDGTLVPLAQPSAALFHPVHAGELVARFDDRVAQARLETVRAEVVHLRKTLEAERERVALSEADRQQEHVRDAARLAWELEQQRLDALDRQATIEGDEVVLQRLRARVAFLAPLHEQGMVSDVEFSDEQLLMEEAAKRLEKNRIALDENRQQQQSAQERLAAFPPLVVAEVSSLLTEIQAEIEVQEALLGEIQAEIESLEVRTPIGGTIVAVYRYPGQGVKAGDLILTVASEESRYILSYVPQERTAQMSVGARVRVRARAAGSVPVDSVVDWVGPQVELVPLHHLRNPQVPEWGLPVRILLPDGLPVRPGELIDVSFHSRPLEHAG